MSVASQVHPILGDQAAWSEALGSFSQATGLACTLFDHAGGCLLNILPTAPESASRRGAPEAAKLAVSNGPEPLPALPEEIGRALETRATVRTCNGSGERWAIPVHFGCRTVGAVLVWDALGLRGGEVAETARASSLEAGAKTLDWLVEGFVRRRASQLEPADGTARMEAEADQVRHEKLRALGDLATGIAHNFNNTLCAVVSHAELIRRHRVNAPESIRAMAQTIIEAAMQGSITANKMLEFARGTTNPHVHPVLLTQVVDDVLQRDSSQWQPSDLAARERIRLVLQLEPTPPIAGRQAELRQLLCNVLANAVEAMPRGGELCIASGREESGRCFLSVSDTGIGMTEEVRRNMFDPFFTTKGPGSDGLGLSVVYGILRRHQGEVEVQSQPGAGTRIKLMFRPWKDQY